MRIGIYAAVSKIGGGVYQYTQALSESLLKYTNYDYLIIKNREFKISELNNNYHFVEIKTNPSNIQMRIKRALYVNFPIIRNFLDVSKDYDIVRKYNLDLIINPTTSLVPVYVGCPYIVIIHDLQHKYYPEFFTLRERLTRNFVYKNTAKNALLVVCESNFVKKDAVNFLGINEDKIKILPSPPPSYLSKIKFNEGKFKEVREKYKLQKKYLLYPAQFWYHKNHIKLLESLYCIKQKYGGELSLILTGSKKNNFENVMRKINELGTEGQVKYLGYVPDEDMPYLYKLSTALVMPTLFESVSMPIWEAFHFGCPVVSSNVCALPEQVGDAGLLFDPNDAEDMAEKIYRIWTDEVLRQEIIKKGYERVKDMTLENYAWQWEGIIKEALERINK